MKKKKVIKSNLRYAGGKTRLIKYLDEYFPKEIDNYLEVFVGGGSVLLHIIQKYNPKNVIANDIDTDLITYYKCLQENGSSLKEQVLNIKNEYTSETFKDKFDEIKVIEETENIEIAKQYFILNKTSFSGLKRGNYSKGAFDSNFSINSINKLDDISNIIKNVSFTNENFKNINAGEIKGYFIYLDPPYYENRKKGLYGKKGELHTEFDHIEFKKFVDKLAKNNKVMVSYDNVEYINDLYKDYKLNYFDVKYSMTNTGGNKCKLGKEIIITNY